MASVRFRQSVCAAIIPPMNPAMPHTARVPLKQCVGQIQKYACILRKHPRIQLVMRSTQIKVAFIFSSSPTNTFSLIDSMFLDSEAFKYLTNLFKSVEDQDVTVAFYGPYAFLLGSTPQVVEVTENHLSKIKFKLSSGYYLLVICQKRRKRHGWHT